MTATADRIPVPVHVTEAQAEAIPAELRALPQWVCARIVREGDRLNKVPVNARTGGAASSTDPATWSPFAVALDHARRDGLALGFVLTEGSGIVAIDLDHVRVAATGAIAPWADTIVAAGDTYAEVSVSGTGIHLFVAGRKPGPKCRHGDVEMYDTGRFIVVTGDRLAGAPSVVALDHGFVADVYRQHLDPQDERPTPRPAPVAAPLHADDEEILGRCRRVPRFEPLWQGDTGAHGGDHSAADLSLVSLLAWAGADEAQADRLFRNSGLYREKWDQRRGALTYGERTITRAFADLTDRWEPPWTSIPGQGAARAVPAIDPDLPLPDDVPTLKGMVRHLTAELDAARAAIRELDARVTTLSELQSRNAGILRNKHLGAERQTAVAIGNILANRQDAEPTDDGMHLVYLEAVAEAAGVSTDAAARHIKRLAEMDTGLRKETRNVRTPRGVERRVYIGFDEGTNVVDFAAAVAALRPDTPRNGWGGRRVTCPHCGPETPVIKRTEMICTGCGELLDRREEIVKPQDAVSGDETEPIAAVAGIDAGPETVMPQDAVSRIAPLDEGADTDPDVLPHLAVSGQGDPIMPPVDVRRCRSGADHAAAIDPEEAERDRRLRRQSRQREADRLLRLLRLQGARPRLVGETLAYDEGAVSERVQGQVSEVRREMAELLLAERLIDGEEGSALLERIPGDGALPEAGPGPVPTLWSA